LDRLAEFMQRHPGMEVEPEASDREVDLIERKLDVAMRLRQMRDSELVARKLGELRIVLFGAPAYFARRGRPQHPDALVRHHIAARCHEARSRQPFRHAPGWRDRFIRARGAIRLAASRRMAT
jgi:DNA-binding transcriptional LysR family regulator